ncbi:type II secretion system F family protein [Ilumatobacter sp.]|uniref:type II secretion system F family protein n=1 Tax=Ilumatobacter sp. TaxID=1967498 RepID=UPI003B52E637
MPAPLVALLAAALVAAAVGCVAVATSPDRPAPARRPVVSATASTQGWVLASAAAGVLVALLTRWPVGALAVAIFVASWRWSSATSETADDRARVEAVAQWLEDLRDVVRRSSVTIEDAVVMVADDATGTLADPMDRFVLRRRQGLGLAECLAGLADEIAHPTADAAIAAIILVVGGGAGGGRVHDTLDELSRAARDEMAARDQIDRTRRIYQRAMRRLVGLTFLFIAGLTAFAGELMAPYRTVAGQIWLVVPCSMWAGCLVVLRRLTRDDLGTRYRLRLPAEVGA